MMKFLVGSCEQCPMLRDGTVLRSSAVTIGTNAKDAALGSMIELIATILMSIWMFTNCTAH